MSEHFVILFQDGFFKIIDVEQNNLFKNFCKRHKGKFGKMSLENGVHISIDDEGVVTEVTND